MTEIACAASKARGTFGRCSAPDTERRHCRVCNHPVCDTCEPPHLCSHDDRRRIRSDGYGYFGFCNHANACSQCHGHGIHTEVCLFRRADTANVKLEHKRLVERDKAIAAIDAAIALLPQLRAALPTTDVKEDILTRLATAIPIEQLHIALIAMTGSDKDLATPFDEHENDHDDNDNDDHVLDEPQQEILTHQHSLFCHCDEIVR